MATSELCSRCGLAPARALLGLCGTCSAYRARTGRDRPADLIARAIDRQDEIGVTPAVTVAVETEGQRLRRREAEAYRDRQERLRREGRG